MEAESCHIRNGAYPSAVVFCTDGMGTIFNKHQSFFLAECRQSIQLHCLSGKIYCYHRFGMLSHMFFHGSRVNVVGALINIGKHRPGAAVQGTVCGCRKGNGCGNHLIPLCHACCLTGYVQGCRAVAADHRIFSPCQFTQFLFQFLDFGSAG